jgi:hypothetical protein
MKGEAHLQCTVKFKTQRYKQVLVKSKPKKKKLPTFLLVTFNIGLTGKKFASPVSTLHATKLRNLKVIRCIIK